jgi:hypothetical protein
MFSLRTRVVALVMLNLALTVLTSCQAGRSPREPRAVTPSQGRGTSEAVYASSARLYIQPDRAATRTTAPVTERGVYLATQCERIVSPALLSNVLEKPEVKALPNFSKVADQLAYLGQHVSAKVGRYDDIVTVTVESPDPNESAVLANSVVEAFIQYRRSSAEEPENLLLARWIRDRDRLSGEQKQTRDQIDQLVKSDQNLELQRANELTAGSAADRLERAERDYAEARREALRASDKRQRVEALRATEKQLLDELEQLGRRITERHVGDDNGHGTPVMVIEPAEAATQPVTSKAR